MQRQCFFGKVELLSLLFYSGLPTEKKILYSSVNKKVLSRTRPEALPERYRHTRTVLPDSVRVTASVVNGFVRSKRHCETFTRFLNYRTNSLIAELLQSIVQNLLLDALVLIFDLLENVILRFIWRKCVRRTVNRKLLKLQKNHKNYIFQIIYMGYKMTHPKLHRWTKMRCRKNQNCH